MKDNPIEVQVTLTLKAVVKGQSVESIRSDCEKLEADLFYDMEHGGCGTRDVSVEYTVVEITSETG
jgi:hypothetical protein